MKSGPHQNAPSTQRVSMIISKERQSSGGLCLILRVHRNIDIGDLADGTQQARGTKTLSAAIL